MRRTQIYLDTSVINYLFADDVPEKRDHTIEFFETCVKPGIYEVCISQIVIDEIDKTQDAKKRELLLDAVKMNPLEILDIDPNYDDILIVSKLYMEQNIIPQSKIEDAMHIAISTVFEMDILLSWNYKHLANVNKEKKIQAVNMLAGYSKPLRMINPMEVIYDDETGNT